MTKFVTFFLDDGLHSVLVVPVRQGALGHQVADRLLVLGVELEHLLHVASHLVHHVLLLLPTLDLICTQLRSGSSALAGPAGLCPSLRTSPA